MSITQTYFLAQSARGKLSKEASRGDHQLRLLVGHANLLDSLMLDLACAEQEQEQWFTKSLSHSEELGAEADAEWESDGSEDSDEYSDDEQDELAEQTREITAEISPSTVVTATELLSDEDEKEEDEIFEVDDEEDFGDLALTRTASRYSPPGLSSDSESDSEGDDEHLPPSPPSATYDAFTEHQRQAIAQPSKDVPLSESQQEAFIEEGFFLPSRPPHPQPSLIAAF